MIESISEAQLRERLDTEPPQNNDREHGYALVNVLSQNQFADEHIPHSIGIPKENIDEFVRSFERTKELIVYCASAQCPASHDVAEKLVDLGFESVTVFPGGMQEWKQAGNSTLGRTMHAPEQATHA